MQSSHFLIKSMRFLITILACAVVILAISCTAPETLHLNDSSMYLDGGEAQYSTIPYADNKKLEELADEEGILDYRIVRKTAIIEFEIVYRKGPNWPKGVRVSKLPVVLYTAQSEPELYEFIVLEERSGIKVPIGTIATYVKPSHTEIIRNVLPYIRDYKAYKTKYKNYDQIVSYYPSEVYVGIATKGSGAKNIINPYTGKRVEMPITKGKRKKTKVDKEFEKLTKEYWDVILQHKKEILAMKDEEIYAKLETKWKENVKKFTREYIVEKFRGFETKEKSGMARTLWNGWCVPSAIAELVWVWNDGMYNGKYIPNVDDGDDFIKIEGFSEEFKDGVTRDHYRYRFRTGPGFGYFVGMYRFTDDAEPGKDRSNPNSSLTDLKAIRYLSSRIDNGLYADIVKDILKDNKNKKWDGSTSLKKGAEAAKKVTDGKMNFIRLNGNPRVIYNHIRTEGPVIDEIAGKGISHARLLIGVKYSWQEKSILWHASDKEARDLKWGWLFVKADWWKTYAWKKYELNKTLGYVFLVWDNGFNVGNHDYLPYWENSNAYTRPRSIGFYW